MVDQTLFNWVKVHRQGKLKGVDSKPPRQLGEALAAHGAQQAAVQLDLGDGTKELGQLGRDARQSRSCIVAAVATWVSCPEMVALTALRRLDGGGTLKSPLSDARGVQRAQPPGTLL